MKRQSLGLTVFLLAPLVVMVILTWAIVVSLKKGPEMRAPHFGAGAGSTGGANQIGEWIAGKNRKRDEASPEPLNAVRPESLAQGFTIVVHDATMRADAASPIYLASNINDWDTADPSMKLIEGERGTWSIHVEKPEAAKFEFRVTRGGWDKAEVKADLGEVKTRTLPGLDPAKLKEGEPPVFEFTVERWADQRGG